MPSVRKTEIIPGIPYVHSSIPVVTIGLNTTTYSVCEDEHSVIVTLSVQAGTLDRDVIVTLKTMNSTAMRESLKALKN